MLMLLALVVLVGALFVVRESVSAPEGKLSPSNSSTVIAAFDKSQLSTTSATSIWVVVNKQHPLEPRTYVPAKLVVPLIQLRSNITSDERHVSSVMAPALKRMSAAAKQAHLTLTLESGYRSYNTQVSLYGSYVAHYGQTAADRFSARPGYSEHQTGLAADLGGVTKPACNVAQCFASTPEGIWLANHSYQYGFIIRYTTAKESVTGYENEPWHVRYVGVALATEMHRIHVTTLEEFFNVTGGTSYKP